MRGRRGKPVAETMKVREDIDRWRRTRKKRARMPEELWTAAAGLARVHGVYRISQDLEIRYDTLKTRLTQLETASRLRPSKRTKASKSRGPSTKFVEIRPPSAATGVVVEVQDASGAKLTIRLGAEAALDVGAIVRAFRSDSRRARRR